MKCFAAIIFWRIQHVCVWDWDWTQQDAKMKCVGNISACCDKRWILSFCGVLRVCVSVWAVGFYPCLPSSPLTYSSNGKIAWAGSIGYSLVIELNGALKCTIYTYNTHTHAYTRQQRQTINTRGAFNNAKAINNILFVHTFAHNYTTRA